MIKSLKKEALVVMLGSFAVTVKALLFFKSFLHFELGDDYGIVSWVTINNYPMQSHVYYYALSFIAAALGALIFYLFWNFTGIIMAKISKLSARDALKIDAATYVFGIIGLLIFFIDKDLFLKTLTSFITLIFVSKLFAVPCYRFFVRNKVIDNTRDAFYAIIKRLKRRRKIIKRQKASVFLQKLFIYAIIPVIIYFLFYKPGLNRPLDFVHEGDLLAPYQAIEAGGVPYRDFHIPHGIIHDVWLPYVGLKLFGATLEGFRRFYDFAECGLIAPFGYIAFYFLCLSLFRRKLTIFLTFLFFTSATGIATLAGRQLFPIMALTFLVSFIDKNKSWKLFASGISVAIAIMFSIDLGMLSLAAITLFLIFYFFAMYFKPKSYSIKYFFTFAGGVAAGILPLMLYLAKTGGLRQYFDIIVSNSMKLYFVICGSPFGAYHEEKYFPIIVYLIVTVWLVRDIVFRNFTKTNLKATALLIAGVFYFYTALLKPDGPHIIFATFPVYLLVFIPVESFFLYMGRITTCDKKKLWRRDFGNIVIAFLCIVAILGWAIGRFSPKHVIEKFAERIQARNVIPEGYVRIGIERAGNIYVPKPQAEKVRAIVEFIQDNTEDGDYIYDFSSQPLYYFLTNRNNPTRYAFLHYSSTPGQQAEVIKDLKENRPQYVLFENSEYGGIEFKKRCYIIWPYIDTNYEPVFEKDGFYILKIKEGVNL
ncbi:MAG: hypothetical protein HQ549_04720 [Candidatus Omnitrophica bacterium]|nr:hypothetical protein [Candidatus Omnitrophota bacterium]